MAPMPSCSRRAIAPLAVFATFAVLATSGFVAAGSVRAQGAQADLPRPLSFENALDLATSRNLGLEAARRQRARTTGLCDADNEARLGAGQRGEDNLARNSERA